MNCINYRGSKLLTHIMKFWERTIDQRLMDITTISYGYFGFRPGAGTTAAKNCHQEHVCGGGLAPLARVRC